KCRFYSNTNYITLTNPHTIQYSKLHHNSMFEKEFRKWTSGNSYIDDFIQQIQLKAQYAEDVIEWIPFDKFTNIKYLAKGGFGTVFKAIWTDGYIKYWDYDKWERTPQRSVCLKSLSGSKDIKREFLNESCLS
ncbi:hypothetical protein C2G38_2099987, partial [Gigaspora rosea]